MQAFSAKRLLAQPDGKTKLGMKEMTRELIEFIGLKLDAISIDQALSKVREFVDSEKYHYQISVNAAKLVYAQKNKRLKQAINSADIINADGVPIHIAVKLMSGRKTSRMGGYDYIDGLAQRYPDIRYYLLGARQEVVDKVVIRLRNKYGLNIVGYRNGYFSEQELPHIIDEINTAKADILFLAIGTPAKEYLLHDLRSKLSVKLAVGVGGAFDIIAGQTKRAPLWMQKCGLEWCYRIYQEPRRMWKRYAKTNPVFIWMVLREWLKQRR